jgi:hypothetical protein
MKRLLALPCLLALPLAADAASLTVDVEIPRLDVAEYHRPYVAVWIEGEDSRVAGNLAVWYQQERAKPRPQPNGKDAGEPKAPPQGGESAGKDGTTWLPDLRQWWRRSGRTLSLPVDGVTGATRPVGTHTLQVDDSHAPLQGLPAGNYRLVVEAAREVGGRELLKLPFAWPPAAASESTAQGRTELGRIALRVTP